MEQITNKTKKCLSLVIAVILVMSLCSMPAKAATKKKSATIYIGEELNIYPVIGTIKKAISSKSKIASVKKSGSSVIVTAKKAGKTNVTLKGSYGNCVYKVTVKKPQFDLSVSQVGADRVLLTLKNQSTAYYDTVNAICTLYDVSGNPVSEKEVTFYAVGAKKTAYVNAYTYDEYVDMSKTTAVINAYRRNTNKCKDYTSKVDYGYNVVQGTYRNQLRVTTSTNYNGNGYIKAAYDVVFYDVVGNIVSVVNNYASLYSTKRIDTDEISFPESAVRYEVKERAFLYTY